MITHSSGENFTLTDLMQMESRTFEERLNMFEVFYDQITESKDLLYRREIIELSGREAVVRDPYTGECSKMLMFGSNNYLGFANHPYIKKRIDDNFSRFGSGLGGPPLLNGYTTLHKQLEERLAALKHKEAAILFSSGFSANFGLATAVLTRKTMVVMDECCHASFVDGVLMSRSRFKMYAHNDMHDLERCLEQTANRYTDVFVATEGVFSMDGDKADLSTITELKQNYPFIIILDDAHGLGVLGKNGHGAHEQFDCDDIDIIMGTFSKTLASSGGFVAANARIINFMRLMTRTYMFSASLPPIVISQILAGLELIETEKWRVKALRDNMALLLSLLDKYDIPVHETDSAIVTIPVPVEDKIRQIGKRIHDAGIFLNTIEFPAVPKGLERIRISIMADHTSGDIEKLARVLCDVFH